LKATAVVVDSSTISSSSNIAVTYWHRDARKAARHGIPGDGFAADGSEYCRLLTADPPDTCHV